jgi:hypothetical protein
VSTKLKNPSPTGFSKNMADTEKREKRSRKTYDDRDDSKEGSKTLRVSPKEETKTLRKVLLTFLSSPRESVVELIKEVRKLDYKKLMEKYFYVAKDTSMDI